MTTKTEVDMSAADVEHATISTRLISWFLSGGWAPENVLAGCGLLTSGRHRVPDLLVYRKPPPRQSVCAPTASLQLAVEIVSRASGATDHGRKKDEYAQARIRRYWVVDRDAANTVTMWTLVDRAYLRAVLCPLETVLRNSPRRFLR
jgi:Uma2 family endonuclease